MNVGVFGNNLGIHEFAKRYLFYEENSRPVMGSFAEGPKESNPFMGIKQINAYIIMPHLY